MTAPTNPKIYHIVHLDRLPSILADGYLYCDRVIAQRSGAGTMIGMNHIKHRRMHELRLDTYPDLFVGDCVPFYFCPRSVMLYIIHRAASDDLAYKGGQQPIVHLEADLHKVINWASQSQQKWVFTDCNAGARYFDDSNDLVDLANLRWDSIQTNQWAGEHKEGKQAEFLLENRFPWHLVDRIGVFGQAQQKELNTMLSNQPHQPIIEVKREWYY
jgi:hypothetical protein